MKRILIFAAFAVLMASCGYDHKDCKRVYSMDVYDEIDDPGPSKDVKEYLDETVDLVLSYMDGVNAFDAMWIKNHDSYSKHVFVENGKDTFCIVSTDNHEGYSRDDSYDGYIRPVNDFDMTDEKIKSFNKFIEKLSSNESFMLEKGEDDIIRATFVKNLKQKLAKGAENACQFVKEKIPELRDDIASIEVVKTDTLLGDIILIFEKALFAKAGSDFLNETITREEYEKIIDERELVLTDIGDSWQFGIVVNDSLRQLEKYKSCWRKVYKVKVTMKSGVTREPRVLMDSDGMTPRMLEKEFGRSLEEYWDGIIKARRYLRMY